MLVANELKTVVPKVVNHTKFYLHFTASNLCHCLCISSSLVFVFFHTLHNLSPLFSPIFSPFILLLFHFVHITCFLPHFVLNSCHISYMFLQTFLPLLTPYPLFSTRRRRAGSRSLPASSSTQTSTLRCHGESGPSAPLLQ